MSKVLLCTFCKKPFISNGSIAMGCPHCMMFVPEAEGEKAIEKFKETATQEEKEKLSMELYAMAGGIVASLSGEPNKEKYEAGNERALSYMIKANEINPNNYQIELFLATLYSEDLYLKKRASETILTDASLKHALEMFDLAKSHCPDKKKLAEMKKAQFETFFETVSLDVDKYIKDKQNRLVYADEQYVLDILLMEIYILDQIHTLKTQYSKVEVLLNSVLKTKRISDIDAEMVELTKQSKEIKKTTENNKPQIKHNPVWNFVYSKIPYLWGISIGVLILLIGVYGYMFKYDHPESMDLIVYIITAVFASIVFVPVILSVFIKPKKDPPKSQEQIKKETQNKITQAEIDAKVKSANVELQNIPSMTHEEFMNKYHPGFSLESYANEATERMKKINEESQGGANE